MRNTNLPPSESFDELCARHNMAQKAEHIGTATENVLLIIADNEQAPPERVTNFIDHLDQHAIIFVDRLAGVARLAVYAAAFHGSVGDWNTAEVARYVYELRSQQATIEATLAPTEGCGDDQRASSRESKEVNLRERFGSLKRRHQLRRIRAELMRLTVDDRSAFIEAADYAQLFQEGVDRQGVMIARAELFENDLATGALRDRGIPYVIVTPSPEPGMSPSGDLDRS